MEAVLAIIASLFAIIQGGVWLLNGIQNHRAKQVLREIGSVSYPLTVKPQEYVDTAHGTSGPPSPAISVPLRDSMPHKLVATNVLGSAAQTGEAGNHSSSIESASGTGSPTTPEEVIEYWQTRSRFRRIVRGIWHATLIAFLPVFSVLSPMGLAIAVLFPFRDSVADPTFYEEGPVFSLILVLILVVPGVVAFRHRPTSSLHKWVRRICLVIAVLVAILWVCFIAFVEPS